MAIPILANTETGKASYYSIKCNGGTRTASGEKLVDSSNTIAHKTLPFGTLVKVTNLKNGKSEIVRVNNRGPYIKGRIVDVTIGVAKKLDFVEIGVIPVKIELVGEAKNK
jgi:rare lipoprotein A